MDKIYRIQRTQVKIQSGIFFSILFVFLGFPMVETVLSIFFDVYRYLQYPYLLDFGFVGYGEWHFIVLIIIIFANIALSCGWRHIANKRIKAIVEEFNKKCEYHT